MKTIHRYSPSRQGGIKAVLLLVGVAIIGFIAYAAITFGI